ncbi:Catechol 1,2-dioxygenase [Golovinomyces cichoracearum]|uniref:Catechol 1,2-dioxygenase n=1 Tax=Golovinomyces cichoracearum TaxID=62708 RepID=A0A420HMY6_9PEZI|nr:Catechol 1,2-dioxygenase [Golovinomyces cichoracearum]
MGANSKFNPDFTQNVIDASGPDANPRLRQLVGGLVQHIHDFLRENEVTHEEWNIGLEYLSSLSKAENKNLIFRSFGLFGINTLLDEIADRRQADLNIEGTPRSPLGPLFREGAPLRENGSSLFTGAEDAPMTYLHGTVSDRITKKPVAGALIDIWQASTNGLYEDQDKDQVEYNLRGKFKTDDNGNYGFYCLRPTKYSAMPGEPFNELLRLLDRPMFRPGHIHFKVECEGYKSLITQIYDSKDPYLTKDVVFGVRDKLTVDFKPLEGNPKAKFEVEFPIILVPTNLESS